jgi:hypothetical protein
MRAHHGRPGGRALELLLLFALIGFSAAVLIGGVGLFFGAFAYVEVHFGHIRGKGAGALFILVYTGLLLGLGLIWKVFLKYYKYDPNSLKPLTEGTSDDRKSD